MILLDTSVLIDALTGPKRSAPALRAAIESGERFVLPSLVLYEWLRGPRRHEELAAQEALLPREQAMPFGTEEAALADRAFRGVTGRFTGPPSSLFDYGEPSVSLVVAR